MGNTDNKHNVPKETREEAFHRLCYEKDDGTAVREALERQPELVHSRDARTCWSGFTALHHAAHNGHEKVVQVLLEHGAEVNARNGRDWTPLHMACGSGYEQMARVLLEHAAEVDVQSEDGETPLHSASFRGHQKVVQVLLEHHAKVNVQNSNGWTPLHLAALAGRVELARVLLEHGADRAVENHDGETPRDSASFNDRHDAVVLLSMYFPVKLQMEQVLLGMKGPSESALTRLAGHELFEPKVLVLVKSLVTGEESPVFDQLQEDAQG